MHTVAIIRRVLIAGTVLFLESLGAVSHALLACSLLALTAMMGCRREFDSPFSPGSPAYAGDAWALDRDGDGISDSVARYLPGCDRGPERCLADSRRLSLVWDKPRSLLAGDMILWTGGGREAPALEIVPADLALRGSIFTSSDSAAVMPTAAGLLGRAPGQARITARLAGEALSVTFAVKVVAEGRRVKTLAARDLEVPAGRDTAPLFAWFPEDASYREFSLASADPSVVLVFDNRLRALREGIARVTARALDGGSRADFLVKVGPPPVAAIRVESLTGENLSMVAGEGPRDPLLVFTPPDATDQGYVLLSTDTAVVTLDPPKLRLIARKAGRAVVSAISRDGGKVALFTVTVIDTAVGPDPDPVVTPNRPPVATIGTPARDATYRGGQSIAFAGAAMDPEEGALGAFSFTWEARIVNVTEWNPDPFLFGPAGGLASGSFTVPASLRAGPGSVIRIVLTVVDSGGLAARDSLDLRPSLSDLVLRTSPPGLVLGFDGGFGPAPSEYRGIAGTVHRLAAPSPQILEGRRYAFAAWSDGRDADHDYVLPPGAASLTASFSLLVDSVRASDLRMSKGDPDRDPLLAWWPSDAADQRYTLESLDTSVVTVVNGKLHAKGSGYAEVVVASLDGAHWDTFEVAVSSPTFTLAAKARDFLEVNNTGAGPVHPDFNSFYGCLDQGYVKKSLEASASSFPEAFPGDARNPVFAGRYLSAEGIPCFAYPSRFAEWFNDRQGPPGTAQDINRAFLTDLTFTRKADGSYEFRDKAFFPLDNRAPLRYRKFKAGDPDPYGHLNQGKIGMADLSAHNYGFTLEAHATFTYRAGIGQFIDFTGDDDVWIFVDGKLVIDLGGIHGPESASVKLDEAAAALGLADKGTYKLDLFFAERRVTESSFALTLGMELRP